MPAVMRDAPGRPAKPRAAVRGRPAPGPQRKTNATPTQLRSGRPVGLSPHTALVAACVVLAGGLVLMLSTGGRSAAIKADVETMAARHLAGLGFAVKAVELEGASRFSVPYILQAADVAHGAPILDLNLAQVRERVEKVGWVKSVRVLRLLPDTLVIAVSERPRLAVWQNAGRTTVVDPEGQAIPEADPGLFVDLPLVVGDGAAQAAAAILPLITSRPRLMSRLEALVRVDQRRWDIRLKDGGLIQLPASDEDSALIQLDELDQKNRLFDLGFERIDLRDPELIAVHPRQAPSAAAALPATKAAPSATTPQSTTALAAPKTISPVQGE